MPISIVLTRYAARAMLVIAVIVLVSCGPDVTDEQLVQSAKVYMAKNQISEAAIELKNALQTNPDNAEARFLLGKINMQVGYLASAEKEYQRALELGWNAEDAMIGKIRALLEQRKNREIIELVYSVNDWSDTAHASYLGLKALAYIYENKLDEARDMLVLAEKIDAGSYDVLKARIMLQLSQNNIIDAEKTLLFAQNKYPGNTELLLIGANINISNSRYQQAIKNLEQVIKLGPENFLTLNVKRAYLGMLKLAVQEKDYNYVNNLRDILVKNKINDPEVNYYLALSAFYEGRYDQSESYLQKILNITSDHGPTLQLSGSVSFAKRDFEKAAYYLSKYVANYPENSNARKLLGRAYMALGQYEAAQSEFNLLLDEKAEDSELMALLSLSEISSGQVQSGIDGLEKALIMSPDSSSIKLQLAKAYILDGKTEKAINLLDEILQKDRNNEQIKTIKVLAYLHNQDIEMAMNTAQQMLLQSSNRPDLLALMGRIQLLLRDTQTARKYFERALDINADHFNSKLNLARLDEQQGNIESAERRYLSILEAEPDNFSTIASLARLAAQRGDTENQVKWLETARKNDSKEPLSRIALVEVYLNDENIVEAEKLIRELEEINPDAVAVLAVKSKLLMAQKRFTQAEPVIAKIIAARPDLDVGFYLQAQNAILLGKIKTALVSSRNAYHLNPDALRNVVLLARIEQVSGNYDRVVELADKLISIEPDSAAGYVINGDAMLAKKNYLLAQANYDKAWSITKSRDIAIRRFKAALLSTGLVQAEHILTGWVEAHPEDHDAILELAKAYHSHNQNKKAIMYYEKVLEIQSDNIFALNNLSWLYGLENNPRALVLAKTAYTLQPESPSIIDTYGWILLKNNKTSEARTMLKRAAELLPDNLEVQYHYAKALYMTGDRVEAKRILKTLVESAKEFEGKIDAEKILAL